MVAVEPQGVNAERRHREDVMRKTWLVAALVLAAGAAYAQPREETLLRQLTAQVSADRQASTIRTLVGFGTRHTLSDTTSNTRGIGAARRWVAAEFQAISKSWAASCRSPRPLRCSPARGSLGRRR